MLQRTFIADADAGWRGFLPCELAEGHLTPQVFVKRWRHTGLLAIFHVERALDVARPSPPHLLPERLHGVYALLLADPGEPAMSRGDVRDLIGMDDIQHLHAVFVSCLLEFSDRPGIDVEAARLVDQMNNGEAGA